MADQFPRKGPPQKRKRESLDLPAERKKASNTHTTPGKKCNISSRCSSSSQNLLRPSDKHLISDFIYLTIEQFELCFYTEDDAKDMHRKVRAIGMPGLACKHCMSGKARFFFGTELGKNLKCLSTHIQNCANVSDQTKQLLSAAKMMHDYSAKDRASFSGSFRTFYDALWGRMNAHRPSVTDKPVVAECEESLEELSENLLELPNELSVHGLEESELSSQSVESDEDASYIDDDDFSLAEEVKKKAKEVENKEELSNSSRRKESYSSPLPSEQLVTAEDMAISASYYYILFQQFQVCTYAKKDHANRNQRARMKLGTIGLYCKHCASKGIWKGRHFVADWKGFNNTRYIRTLDDHVNDRCTEVPESVKTQIVAAKTKNDTTTKNKNREFLNRLWHRMNGMNRYSNQSLLPTKKHSLMVKPDEKTEGPKESNINLGYEEENFTSKDCFVLQQFKVCHLNKDDKKRRGRNELHLGNPGLHCKYCACKGSFDGRFFYGESCKLKNMIHCLHRHISRCRVVPVHIRRQIACNKGEPDKQSRRKRVYLKDVFNHTHPELFQTGLMANSSISLNESSGAESNSLTVQADEPLHLLVVPSDRDELTDYIFLILRQFEFCMLAEEDKLQQCRGRWSDLEIGFPGMACIHCRDSPCKKGRFFRKTVSTLRRFQLADTRVAHLLECRAAPNDVKVAIKDAWKRHKSQAAVLGRGFLVAFCRKLWDKMFAARKKRESESSSTLGSTNDQKLSSLLVVNPSSAATQKSRSIARNSNTSTITASSGMAAFLAAKHSEFIPDAEDVTTPLSSGKASLAKSITKDPSTNTTVDASDSSGDDSSSYPQEATRLVTDFMDCIMKNVKIWKLPADSDEKPYNADVRCKHCGGGIGKGSESFICTSGLDISSLGSYATEHLVNCYDVPVEIKDSLQQHFASHKDQLQCLQKGGMSTYFDNLWDELREKPYLV